ncbi:MAG: MarR family winged helix-turn-helix transcriptional regulator [Pirellulales bacterium]
MEPVAVRPTAVAAGTPAPICWAGLFADVTALARRLRVVVSQLASRHGLSEAQFAVLWQCQQAPASGLGQHELAGLLALSTAQISTIVEQLRQSGWLAGHRDPADRRRQCWQLTAAGAEITRRIMGELSDWAIARGLPCDNGLPGSLQELLLALSADEHAAPALRLFREPSTPPPASSEAPS